MGMMRMDSARGPSGDLLDCDQGHAEWATEGGASVLWRRRSCLQDGEAFVARKTTGAQGATALIPHTNPAHIGRTRCDNHCTVTSSSIIMYGRNRNWGILLDPSSVPFVR